MLGRRIPVRNTSGHDQCEWRSVSFFFGHRRGYFGTRDGSAKPALNDPQGRASSGHVLVATGERLGELRIASAILDESAQLRAAFAVSHAELFERSYVSGVRYLLRAE